MERAAAHAEELKDLYDQICVVLCQMKDIRGSLRRCRELEVPDHVELFELKGYLQRLETLRPLFEKLRDTAGLTGLAFHDPAAALAILDPENTRSRGFYIPDAATPRLREIRSAKSRWRSSCTGPRPMRRRTTCGRSGCASAPRRTARR